MQLNLEFSGWFIVELAFGSVYRFTKNCHLNFAAYSRRLYMGPNQFPYDTGGFLCNLRRWTGRWTKRYTYAEWNNSGQWSEYLLLRMNWFAFSSFERIYPSQIDDINFNITLKSGSFKTHMGKAGEGLGVPYILN